MGSTTAAVMAAAAASGGDTVDLAFGILGEPLPRDHSLALWNALAGAAPKLAEDDTLAILPVRGAAGSDGQVVLQRRSRLLMRMAEARVDALLALSGQRLEIAGAAIVLGSVKTRPLAPHATLYAHRVVAEEDDEAAFVRGATRQLARLGVHGECIVGRRALARGPQGELVGFSLMLAGLTPRESLLLQAQGLGAHRRLGFGIFVGHK